MVTIRSTRYPNLLICDLGVRFVDGLLETDDQAVIARAHRLGRLGVEVDETLPEVAVERVEPPRGNASRAAWEAYATRIGLTIGEDMTRNEIRDLVESESHG